MKPCVRRLASMLLVSGLAAVLWAQDSSEAATKTKILALQHAWDQAETFADLKALDALLDSDLVYVDCGGKLLTKAEVLARVKSTHLQRVVTDSMTVQVFDDTVIVTGTYRSNELRDGKIIVHTKRFTNAWMFKGSRWVCVAAQTTPILHDKEL
jgi:Domain of unknown function (DUF4440)